ncbi:MAG: PorV/PorQ family protein [Candidatus Cloacimonetes bacterium]|nr:PorV/PorQ family protein [Candidatus Cloacimonadota bacterium]MBL7087136.1 PorV/PorQ family protein [Candidatus Cloacimonadota bacterium]
MLIRNVNRPFRWRGKIIIFSLITILIIPTILQADIFAKVGTSGLQFLKISVDARAIGMGEAYTPYVKGASSTYWNPAGLAYTTSTELFLNHLRYVADIKFEYASLATPTSFGVIAFSASLLWMDWMDVTTADEFKPTGEKFTCSDMMAGISYATSLTDKFSLGLTGKYLRQNLDEYDINGWSVDLGTLYNTGWQDLTIGMSLRNFGPEMKYTLDNDLDGLIDEDLFDLLDNDQDGLIDEDREELAFTVPMNFSLGVAMNLLESDMQSLNTVFQLDNCVDRLETYNIGAEYRVGTFFLRSGYQFNLNCQKLSYGLGWKTSTPFAIVDIDVAYTPFGDLEEKVDNSFLTGPIRLSLKMVF